MGLSFEKSQLAIVGKDYLDSKTAYVICQTLIEAINRQPGLEHEFYQQGEAAFHSAEFMEDQSALQYAQAIFGDSFKRIRYHNLIRLGADIERAGLASYPKATILGALLYYADLKRP